jgi:hypothetical protein
VPTAGAKLEVWFQCDLYGRTLFVGSFPYYACLNMVSLIAKQTALC